jgi:hypothetical protein
MRFNLSILVIIAILMLSPLILASQETLGTFKSGECINLRQSCGNCSYSNISQVLYPDSSIALDDVQMEKNNDNYNYTFCTTTQNGEYVVVGISDVDGTKTSWAYNFFVTPTGVVENSIFNNSVVIIILLIALILLGMAGLMHSYPIFFMSGVMWSVAGVYTMIYGFNSYTDDYTRAIAIVFIAIGTIFMVTSGYEWIANITDPDGETYTKDETDESDYFNKGDNN